MVSLEWMRNAVRMKFTKHRTKQDPKKTLEDLHRIILRADLFGLMSSRPCDSKDAVPTCYIRQMAEQYFDIGKGIFINRLLNMRIQFLEMSASIAIP